MQVSTMRSRSTPPRCLPLDQGRDHRLQQLPKTHREGLRRRPVVVASPRLSPLVFFSPPCPTGNRQSPACRIKQGGGLASHERRPETRRSLSLPSPFWSHAAWPVETETCLSSPRHSLVSGTCTAGMSRWWQWLGERLILANRIDSTPRSQGDPFRSWDVGAWV